MQIQHLSSFLSSTYNSIQDRIFSTLNKKYVLITLVVASILALLVTVISIQRKAKLKKMDINAINQNKLLPLHNETQPNHKGNALEAGIKAIGLKSSNPEAKTASPPLKSFESDHELNNLKPITAIKNIEEPTPQTELQPNAEVKTKQLQVRLSPLRGLPFLCTMQGSDTIEILKKQIEKEQGISTTQIKLLFAQQILEDERSLESYGINSDSVIHLILKASPPAKVEKTEEAPILAQKLGLFVKMEDGKTTHWTVTETDKIEVLKKQIKDKMGISPDTIRLTYAGKSLEDDHTFKDYSISDQSAIHFFKVAAPAKAEKAPILTRKLGLFIKMEDGKTTYWHVLETDKIDTLKERIGNSVNVPPDAIRLTCYGRQLDDGQTFKDYSVAHESTIQFTRRLRGD